MNEPLRLVGSSDPVVLELHGSLDQAAVPALRESVASVSREIGGISEREGRKIKILFDMQGFTGEYSLQAMETMVDFVHRNELFVDKTAVFGGPKKARMAGEAVAALSLRQNIRFFDTKEDALAWLG